MFPRAYVDDSKLFLSFIVKELENAANKLDDDLERIAAWCCQNSLLINPDKTKLLLLRTPQMPKRIPEDFCVSLLGKKIFPVSSAKDLGVTLDSCLSYHEHVTDVVSKCTASLCQINSVKHHLNKKSLLTKSRILKAFILFDCLGKYVKTKPKKAAECTKFCCTYCHRLEKV